MRPDATATERLVVAGGAAMPLRLMAGDRVRLVDPEGLQPVRLSLEGGREAVTSALPELAGGDFGEDSAIAILDGTQEAGAAVRFTAARDVECMVEAPGGPMQPDAQDTPTEIHVHVERAGASGERLPVPLAEPRLDLRVPAASARA